MRLSVDQKIFIYVLCLVEQFIYLSATVWLVGWKDWSPHWFWFCGLLLIGTAPSLVIKGLESNPPKEMR